MQYNAQAIVISSRDDRETDRLYTLFTRAYGKVVVRGSGARKGGAKLAPHLDTLMHTNVAIARNRGRGTVVYAVCEAGHAAVRRSPVALAAALRAVTVTGTLLRDEDPHPEVFDTLLVYLHTMDVLAGHAVDEDTLRVVTEGYLFHLLAYLGWQRETSRCARCGASLASGAATYVYALADGGVLCASCAERPQHRRTITLSRDAAAALHVFATNTIPSLAKLAVPRSVCDELRSLLDARVAWVS